MLCVESCPGFPGTDAARGLPHEAHKLGPPQPPCEPDRLATTKALSVIDAPPDPEVENILKIVAGIFDASSVLVAFFDDKRIFIKEAEGVFGRGDFPWRWSFCAWTLSSEHDQIMVIQDTHEDARFANNHMVVSPDGPKIRFYCGTPLIASNGHRLGTLCFTDVKPRKFDAGQCQILDNFAEMVVRLVEKDIALQLECHGNTVLADAYSTLKRGIDSISQCVVLLDTTVEGFKIIYTNLAWTNLTGIDRGDIVGLTLSQVLHSPDGDSYPLKEHLTAVAKCRDFAVKEAVLVLTETSGQSFTLKFRPASKDRLDDSVLPIGIPSYIGLMGSVAPNVQQYYFMTVDVMEVKSKMSSIHSSITVSSINSSICTAVKGLEVFHMLGKGSYGTVYSGKWFGTPVAVKVIDEDMGKLSASYGENSEALLGVELRHPHIVATLHYCEHRSGGGTLSKQLSPTAASATCEADKLVLMRLQTDPTKFPIISLGTLSSIGSALSSTGTSVLSLGTSAGLSSGLPSHDHQYSTDSFGRCSLGNYNDMGNPWGRSSDDEDTEHVQTLMVMEFCDRGCLQDAVDRGWLRLTRSQVTHNPNMDAVLATAHEIASALQYLHYTDIIHGDLSPYNVLLSSGGVMAHVGNRGFVAKIADFGLSRTLSLQSKIQTKTYGTLTHMPPETLLHGTVSKAVDVYSFGVLLWQMFCGSRPWVGLTHGQIIMAIANKQCLVFPEEAPEEYARLAMSCMSYEPEDRPCIKHVMEDLGSMHSYARTQ